MRRNVTTLISIAVVMSLLWQTSYAYALRQRAYDERRSEQAGDSASTEKKVVKQRTPEQRAKDRAAIKTLLAQRSYTVQELAAETGLPVKTVESDLALDHGLRVHPRNPRLRPETHEFPKIDPQQFSELHTFVDDWYFDSILELEKRMQAIIGGERTIFSIHEIDEILDTDKKSGAGKAIYTDEEREELRRELHLLNFVRQLDPDEDAELLGLLFGMYDTAERRLANKERVFRDYDKRRLARNWVNLINEYYEYTEFQKVVVENGGKQAIESRNGAFVEVNTELGERLRTLRMRIDPIVIDEGITNTESRINAHRGWFNRGVLPNRIKSVIYPSNPRTADISRDELIKRIRQEITEACGTNLQQITSYTPDRISLPIINQSLLLKEDVHDLIVEAFPDLVIRRYSIGRRRTLARWMFTGNDPGRWARPLDQRDALEALMEFFNPDYAKEREQLVTDGLLTQDELPDPEHLIRDPGDLTLPYHLRGGDTKGATRKAPYLPGLQELYRGVFGCDLPKMIEDNFGAGHFRSRGKALTTPAFRRKYLLERFYALRDQGVVRSPLDLREEHLEKTMPGNRWLARSIEEVFGGVPLYLLGEDRFARGQTIKGFMMMRGATSYKDCASYRVDAVNALVMKLRENEPGAFKTKEALIRKLTGQYLANPDNAIRQGIFAAAQHACHQCNEETLELDKTLNAPEKGQIALVNSELKGNIKLMIEAGILTEDDYGIVRDYIHSVRNLPNISFDESAYRTFVNYVQNAVWRETLTDQGHVVQLSDAQKRPLSTPDEAIQKLNTHRAILRVRHSLDTKREKDFPRRYQRCEIIRDAKGRAVAIAFHGVHTSFYQNFSYFNEEDLVTIGSGDGKLIEGIKLPIQSASDGVVTISLETLDTPERERIIGFVPENGVLKVKPNPDLTTQIEIGTIDHFIETLRKTKKTSGNQVVDQLLNLVPPYQITLDDIVRYATILRKMGLSNPNILNDPGQLATLAALFNQKGGNKVVYLGGSPGTGKNVVLTEATIIAIRDGRSVWDTAVSHAPVDNSLEKTVKAAGGNINAYRAASSPNLIRDPAMRSRLLYVGQDFGRNEGVGFWSTITGSVSLNSMRHRQFQIILVDEASAVPFPKLLVAASKFDRAGLSRGEVIFGIAGDVKQLPSFPIDPVSLDIFMRMYVEPTVETIIADIFGGNKTLPKDLADRLVGAFPHLPSVALQSLVTDVRQKPGPDPAPRIVRRVVDISREYYDTLFNRGISHMMEEGPFPHFELQTNYRSHWVINALNGLRSYRHDPVEEDTFVAIDTGKKTALAPHPDRRREKGRRGNYTNEYEADLVADTIARVLSKKAAGKDEARYSLMDLVVVAPYQSQVQLLRKRLREFLTGASGRLNITAEDIDNFIRQNVSTIDSFQGSESKVVIASFTRSNPEPHLVGFLNKLERLYVTLSRTLEKTFVIGDRTTLTGAWQNQDDVNARNVFSAIFQHADCVREWFEIQENLALASSRAKEEVPTTRPTKLLDRTRELNKQLEFI